MGGLNYPQNLPQNLVHVKISLIIKLKEEIINKTNKLEKLFVTNILTLGACSNIPNPDIIYRMGNVVDMPINIIMTSTRPDSSNLQDLINDYFNDIETLLQPEN